MLKKLHSNYLPDTGLVILRIGLGIQMALHGWPKITGGTEKWAKLGNNMNQLGISFWPEFWGFMAAFGEFGGGILLLLGFLFRPSLFLLIVTMLVAAVRHWAEGEGYMGGSHAFELMIVFISLFLTGPGKYSLDNRIYNK